VPHAVTEITAFGEVKAYNSYVLDKGYSSLELQGASGFIPSIAYEREVINSTHTYLNSLKELGVNPPFYVDTSILNAKGYLMYTDPGRMFHRSRIYSEEDIRPSMIRIPNETAFSNRQALAKEIKPIFDFIWREFGFERSYNYNEEGEWIKDRL
ncbi:MAG TPA: hypothetical protein VLY86_00270, partial [Methanothrix sp.]|nr:hypothetical protein [Methanothrix sp.]